MKEPLLKLTEPSSPLFFRRTFPVSIFKDKRMGRPVTSHPLTHTYFRAPKSRYHQLSDPVQGGAGQVIHLLDGAFNDCSFNLLWISPITPSPAPVMFRIYAWNPVKTFCIDFIDYFKEPLFL